MYILQCRLKIIYLSNKSIVAPDYHVTVSGGHRAPEAVQLLKEFYNGENPYAPNPKVKGVKLKKEQSNGAACST